MKYLLSMLEVCPVALMLLYDDGVVVLLLLVSLFNRTRHFLAFERKRTHAVAGLQGIHFLARS